jgi:hypothetical protein
MSPSRADANTALASVARSAYGRAMLRNLRATLVLCLLAAMPATMRAQGYIPTFGGPPPQGEEDPGLGVTQTNVGIIDPAVPLTMMRLRFDDAMHDPRPTRAEFVQAKPGFLGGRGQALAETNLVYQDVAAYGEYAWFPFFSTFVEAPYRWLNPDINSNARGYGDMSYGFKLSTWSAESLLATMQFRLYNPTAGNGLGTGHWTAEPALLGAYRITDSWLLEGECRYWIPINGSDFAGNVLRYGLGVSYGQRSDGFWYIPVLEGVGWTCTSGQELVASSPTSYLVQSASGQTIANGYLGVRLGFGPHLDGYLGYGRCFTGNTWQRDFVRAEVRLIY